MRMPVVGVGEMRVCVDQRIVSVPMAVFFFIGQGRIVWVMVV